jgi:F-type H+-transporting ATPase subunit gamma
MQMVSAAKLRRAQTRVLEARPYAAALDAVLRSLASRVASHRHELLVERPEHAVTLVVVTADKGLCGAFNANVLREASALLEGGRWEQVELVLVGRRGIDFFRRRSFTIIATHPELMHTVTPAAAFELARGQTSRFAARDTDAIYILYTHYRSIMRQEVTLERLLPIGRSKIAGGERPGAYIFEPSPQALLGQMLPRHVEFQVLRALLDSQAAEQASRMTAMDAATRNAADMISRLTLTYNRARQAAITKELIEIVSGAQALGER